MDMDKETKDKFFNELMEKAYDKIFTFVSRGSSDMEFAQDVVQETFYEAYRKIDILMEHPNQMGWLYSTAKNKKMKLGKKRGDIYRLHEDYEENLETENNGEEDFGEVELAETIKKSVSEEEYQMLRDYYLNGYTSVEVADKYGIDRGAIRMRMSRLKKRLKENIVVGWVIFLFIAWIL